MQRLDRILAKAAELNDNFEKRQKFLEAECYRMMHHPTVGGQVIARLCATDDEAQQEVFGDLLHNLLHAVRVVRESNLKRGDVFLDTLTDAVGLAAGQRRMTPEHRMLLASTWIRNGLQPPAALEMTGKDIADAVAQDTTLSDMAQVEVVADEAVENLLKEMVETVDGDPFMLYLALIEIFPTMPAQIREHVIAWSVARDEAFHAKLACFWLFTSDATLRLAAARGLAKKAAAGELPANIAGKMVMLRSWMPNDGTRAAVDQILKATMRSGTAAAPVVKPWEAQGTAVTLQDGGGAQSIVIPLRSGRSRKTMMLLLKQGYGVKDAYVIPMESATEQKEFIKHMKADLDCVEVPLAWVENFLAMSMAEGLAAGHSPHPGLVEAAEICGFTNLRPKVVTTKELIDSLPETERIRGLDARTRKSLIRASENWGASHGIASSWIEQDDAAHEILEAEDKSEVERMSALWEWLETRRDHWALHFARAADILSAAEHPDAKNFTAVALDLAEGGDMKKIPIMNQIHGGTIRMWLNDHPDTDDGGVGENSDEEDVEFEDERPGELEELLKDADVTPDWIDGYLMEVTRAPKLAPHIDCMNELSKHMITTISRANVQRFFQLIEMRAEECFVRPADPTMFVMSMINLDKPAMRQWASGFTHAHKTFKKYWPRKSTSAEDQKMIKRIAAAQEHDFDDEIEVIRLCKWLLVDRRHMD